MTHPSPQLDHEEFFEFDYCPPDLKLHGSVERGEAVLAWAKEAIRITETARLTFAEGTTINDGWVFDEETVEGYFVDAFWDTMFSHWNMFDRIDHAAFTEVFRRLRHARSIDAMPTEMKTFYERLPERVAVYRGGPAHGVLGGLSWTLDYEVAENFAIGHRGMKNPNPVVIAGEVNKADIAFATNERGEKEIVVFDAREVANKTVLRVLPNPSLREVNEGKALSDYLNSPEYEEFMKAVFDKYMAEQRDL